MLFHTYTAVHSDGLGIFLKNNANAEMISTFTYYNTVGFACIGGSKIRSPTQVMHMVNTLFTLLDLMQVKLQIQEQLKVQCLPILMFLQQHSRMVNK